VKKSSIPVFLRKAVKQLQVRPDDPWGPFQTCIIWFYDSNFRLCSLFKIPSE